MLGHRLYDWVLSWSGAKQHSRRETPLLKSLHKIWCNAPRSCTGHQGVEQFFAPGAEWYPSLVGNNHMLCEKTMPANEWTSERASESAKRSSDGADFNSGRRKL